MLFHVFFPSEFCLNVFHSLITVHTQQWTQFCATFHKTLQHMVHCIIVDMSTGNKIYEHIYCKIYFF
jgi:hypothetical protein